MTRGEIIKSGYNKHHASYARGYVSRRVSTNTLIAVPYKGKFGEGYVVDTPCMTSTQYCIREYWIKEND